MSSSARPTTHRALGDVTFSRSAVAAVAGLGLAIVGSLGPWATLLAASVPGTHGDGKITLGLAVIALVLVALSTSSKAATVIAAGISIGIAGIAGYDLVRIEHAAARVVLFGAHAASAGWGVYIVTIGGAVAALALLAHALDAR